MSTLPISSTSGHPHYLTGLTAREQVADVLIRACLALDTNDRPLWESAWDASTAPHNAFDINGAVTSGQEAIDRDVFTHAAALDTQHLILNMRIQMPEDGSTTARLHAQGLNQHFRPGTAMALGDTEHFTAGAAYECELALDATGQWKMRVWKLKTLWAQGTWAVMQAMLDAKK